MFKILVGFLIIFSSECFSQANLTELQKLLPKTGQENPDLMKQITKTLERDISLNPELVAYRITYYKKLFDEGIRDNELNGLNNLRLQTSEYYQKRNRWIEKEKEIINLSSYSSTYKTMAIEFISDFITEVIDTNVNAVYNLDKNYVDYFSAIALGTQNLGDFNNTIDYSRSKGAIEKIIKDNQIEKLNYFGSKEDMIEPIEEILDYWYLFPNEDLKKDFVVSDLLLKYFESQYSLNGFPSSEILLGVNFFQIREELDIISNGRVIPKSLVLGDVKNSTQLNLTFNQKIVLKDNLSSFAYLNLGIGAGLSFDANTDIEDNLKVYQKDPLPNDGFISQTWTINNLSSKDPFRASVFINGTVPVLFFNRNIFVQIGFISGFNYASYKLEYGYNYDKVQVVWDENLQRFVSTLLDRKIGEEFAEENNQTKFFIYPTVDLSIYSYNPILLQVSAGYNFISVKVGYGF